MDLNGGYVQRGASPESWVAEVSKVWAGKGVVCGIQRFKLKSDVALAGKVLRNVRHFANSTSCLPIVPMPAIRYPTSLIVDSLVSGAVGLGVDSDGLEAAWSGGMAQGRFVLYGCDASCRRSGRPGVGVTQAVRATYQTVV